MNTVVLGDSLAKGVVHQMARDYVEHLISQKARLQAMGPVRSDCRSTQYKHAIKVISGLFGSGLTRAFESGEGKRKVWTAYAVMTNQSGAFIRFWYRVPFKSPSDFEMEDTSVSAAPHCVQRLVQLHGIKDKSLLQHLWMVHSAALDRAIALGDPNEKGAYITFGVMELLIWRPSESDQGGWVAVTAIGTDALDGVNLKLYLRLKAGVSDKGVIGIDETDYGSCLSRSLRMKLAMAILDVKRKSLFTMAA